MKKHPVKIYPTIGCCGLDCGLCPRFYTVGSSRCPGCCGPDFFNKHPSCGYITCCVKRNQFEVCAQCEEFACKKFESWLTNNIECDSFLTHKNVYSNLIFIKKHGLKKFMVLQKQRIKLLKNMLKDYNDGRSKSFYCVATTLLPLQDLETSLRKVRQKIMVDAIKPGDIKTKAVVLREFLNCSAKKLKIELKLRKKPKL